MQPIRNTYACFGPALAGYVEATFDNDDAKKNRMCPPVPFSNTTADWAHQQVLGAQASFTSHPQLDDWANSVSLNPTRVPPDLVGSGCDRCRPAIPSAPGSGAGQAGPAR